MEAVILGAGVAGVSAAIALRQLEHDVRVYERRTHPATMGGGIVAWPNATFVLDWLGVLPEVKAAAGRPTSMRRLSRSGEPLGAIDIGLINERLGMMSLSVLRRDLQRALLMRLSTLGVEVSYGHNATCIESIGTDGAEVQFDNGARVSADLILGADGRMRSVARTYVHGINTPVYQGFANWVGVFEAPAPVFDEIAISDYWGVGERFGIVPVSDRRAYWAGGAACDEPNPPGENGERVDSQAELLDRFAEWPALVRLMIEHTPADQVAKIFVHDHDPIDVWHRENVLLIGDAAHAPLPTSGQGACQALEDAWRLADCLAEEEGNVPHAIAVFTARRREKTAAITMAARQFAGALFNRDPMSCRARDERSRGTDFAAAAEGMASLWGRGLPIRPV